MKKEEFTRCACKHSQGYKYVGIDGAPRKINHSMVYAGHGRLILIGVSQDIEEQVNSGHLMNKDEYVLWIDYLKEVVSQLETELRRMRESETIPNIVSCETCRKLKEGNLHLPDGSILNNVRVCIDKRCEPGLNTFYRARRDEPANEARIRGVPSRQSPPEIRNGIIEVA